MLIVLVGIFVALPVVLYGQFEEADRRSHELVTESLRKQDWLVAQALETQLMDRKSLSPAGLNATLAPFAGDGTVLKLMFQPRGGGAASGFYLVGSAPYAAANQIDAELAVLARHGILKSLADSCSWDQPVELRYQQSDGREEIMTSALPIQGKLGCWVLVSTNNSTELLSTTFGRPYWQTDAVRMAAVIYLAFAALAVLMALRMRGALRQFRRVAREVRSNPVGAAAFAERNTLPELASVAADFDRLVRDLHRAAANIRNSAEETAHSVKAPLAIIQSALQPLKAVVPPGDKRLERSAQLIETALERLSVQISAAQRLGNDTADFIEAPKLWIDLTGLLTDALQNAGDISLDKNIRFVRHLDSDVRVLAPEGILDIIVENILDNAISFSPSGSTITTTLIDTAGRIDLLIDDQGPGVDAGKIDRIFDRHFSFRPPGDSAGLPAHAGLGLWIVRHHVEALNGTVSASNHPGGGLRIHVCLPHNIA
ncbi:sensor histidine kinase [Radicibacter daui]|uniref:sensor histidine kinase n=1 Tax=Radicibacter daui TaxID=3064829 RepID=UPI004046C36F